MKRPLSVKIALGGALAYAAIAILFNLLTALVVLVVGPTSELYSSALWNLKNLLTSSLVLVAVLVGAVSSITALVRHRESWLVPFLCLTLCCVGLSVQGIALGQFLSQLIHRG